MCAGENLSTGSALDTREHLGKKSNNLRVQRVFRFFKK